MKFRFCGDLDAPDWILKEITILSKIPNIRVRLLCGQVINSIFGEALDYDKIEKNLLKMQISSYLISRPPLPRCISSSTMLQNMMLMMLPSPLNYNN